MILIHTTIAGNNFFSVDIFVCQYTFCYIRSKSLLRCIRTAWSPHNTKCLSRLFNRYQLYTV